MVDRFLDWLRWAIDNVDDGYYSHSERVYCYELYHLIRVRMYMFETRGGDLGGICLNNEIVKRVITHEQAEFHRVEALDGQRIPDFLFHAPGNFESQIATMEVKKSQLSAIHLLSDIRKINDMMERYLFRLGVFHTINNSIEHVMGIINDNRDSLINFRGDILIIVKPGFGQSIHEFRLRDVL